MLLKILSNDWYALCMLDFSIYMESILLIELSKNQIIDGNTVEYCLYFRRGWWKRNIQTKSQIIQVKDIQKALCNLKFYPIEKTLKY